MNLLPSSLTSSLVRSADYVLSTPQRCITRLSNLVNIKPNSADEILQKAKEQGSALLGLDEGEILIEITQKDNGLWVFTATDSMLEHPVVIAENGEIHGHDLWKENVTRYLNTYTKNVCEANYGVLKNRWKGNTFTDLTKHLILAGTLSKHQDRVSLKLTEDDESLNFFGAEAEQKAEIVLKYFYHRLNTPAEESSAKPWNLLKRLFFGYLSISSHLLFPWVNKQVTFLRNRDGDELQNRYIKAFEYDGNHYEFDHQYSDGEETYTRRIYSKDESEEYVTQQKADRLILTQKQHTLGKTNVNRAFFERYNNEWALTKEESHEESPSGRIPLTLSNRVVGAAASGLAAGLIAAHNPKVSLLAGLLSLSQGAEALSAYSTNSTKREIAKNDLARQSNPITMITPLPDLSANSDEKFTQKIDMRQYFALSDKNTNLDLTISQTNKTTAPDWMKMNMGDLSIIKSLHLGGNTQDICVQENLAFAILDNGLAIINITEQKNPIMINFDAQYRGGYEGGFVKAKGDYLFVFPLSATSWDNYNKNIQTVYTVLNINNPNGIVLQNSSKIPIPAKMASSDDYIYAITNAQAYNTGPTGGEYIDKLYLTTIDISNPVAPVQKYHGQVGGLRHRNYSPVTFEVFGDHALIGDDTQLQIMNISNPSLPRHVTYVNTPPKIGATFIKDNYLYIVCESRLQTYDITDITNPVLLSAISIDGTATKLFSQGNYLYAFCQYEGVKVINIENRQMPELFSSILTRGSANDCFFINNYAFTADGPSGLTVIDTAKRVLYGVPPLDDRGMMHIDVIAADELGHSIADPIAIHIGNINVQPIQNQQIYIGNTTLFTFPLDTFEFPGGTFSYTATLQGGLPLPSFINFDPITRTFIFAPKSGDQNTFRIQVTANDGFQSISTSFDLSVVNRPPVVEQPLENQVAYTGESFEYIFENNSFNDLDRDIINYSARLVGTNGLPGWLSFDPVLRKFYGTPFGKNIYPIEVIGNDGFGGTVSSTFTISVPNSTPIVLNPPGTQLASIGLPFSYTFNTHTFYDVDNEPLTYSTGPLPPFLTFNAATKTLSGTPQATDVGTYTISLNAQDPERAQASTSFTLNVLSSSNNNPPVLVKSIPDLSVKTGVPFSYTIDAGTFEDPEGAALTYQATLEDGVPLPDGLYFTSETGILSGMFNNPQSLKILIRAVDPYGAYAIDTFALNVVDNQNYPPIVLNPLPDAIATVGEQFSFRIPPDTFSDPNNDKLEISANQSGGRPLPVWLKWNPNTSTFSGRPGPWDTDTYRDKVIDIEVWASDGKGSTKLPFKVIVQGESFWETFIKYGISFSSIAATGLGFWKGRALVWNYFMKDKYRKQQVERAIVGQPFKHDIALQFDRVKEVKAYKNGKPLSKLPEDLVYKSNQISGTATNQNDSRYTIRIFDHDGYINEEFDLIIKNNEDDPDPVEEKDCLSNHIYSLTRRNNKGKDEESTNSIMMKSLLNASDK